MQKCKSCLGIWWSSCETYDLTQANAEPSPCRLLNFVGGNNKSLILATLQKCFKPVEQSHSRLLFQWHHESSPAMWGVILQFNEAVLVPIVEVYSSWRQSPSRLLGQEVNILSVGVGVGDAGCRGVVPPHPSLWFTAFFSCGNATTVISAPKHA